MVKKYRNTEMNNHCKTGLNKEDIFYRVEGRKLTHCTPSTLLAFHPEIFLLLLQVDQFSFYRF